MIGQPGNRFLAVGDGTRGAAAGGKMPGRGGEGVPGQCNIMKAPFEEKLKGSVNLLPAPAEVYGYIESLLTLSSATQYAQVSNRCKTG